MLLLLPKEKDGKELSKDGELKENNTNQEKQLEK